MIRELDSSSSRADQPAGTRVPLKSHQLTLLRACLEFESPASADANGEYIRSRLGIIGDKVGSGKSYVILSLMLSDLPSSHGSDYDELGFAENTVRIRRRHNQHMVRTSLLVIPHTLVRQWQDYLDAFLPQETKTLIISRSQILDTLDDIGSYDIIVVTNTFYPSLVRMSEGIRWKRVFFDEVDSIKIINCVFIDAWTYWFVTASYNNLLHPHGRTVLDRRTSELVQMSTGIRMSGFVRAFFQELTKSLSPPFTVDDMVLKNADAYVDVSANLPAVIESTLRCLQPRDISILHGLVDHTIMQHLNANDVRGAMTFISPTRRQTEQGIVHELIESYDRKVRNIMTKIEYHRTLLYDDEAHRSADIGRLETQKVEIEGKIGAIQERVKQSTQCPICYEELGEGKCVLPCCQNVFCMRCIGKWFELDNDTCPLCKSHADMSTMFVVDMPEGAEASSRRLMPKTETLIDLFKKIDESGQARRVIVFSQFDNTFEQVGSIMKENAISYEYLHGPCSHISLLTKRYKDTRDDGIRVLLANASNFGSGLNLENTTDIIMFHRFDSEVERQVIGRAQRPGRTTALNVWYLLHDNEMQSTVK